MDLEESSFNSLSLSVWSSSIKWSTRHSVWLGQYDTIICIWNVLTSSSFSNGQVTTNGPPEERNGEQSRPMLIIIICNPIRSSVSKKGDRKRIMGIWMEDEIIVIYELRSRYPINNNDYNTKCNASFHPNETLSYFAPKTLPKKGTSPTTYIYLYLSLTFSKKQTNTHWVEPTFFILLYFISGRYPHRDDGQQATQHSAKNGHLLISIP